VSAYPQIRVVGVAECATHAIVDAVIGKYSESEQRLAVPLMGALAPDMLLLADRGFFSFALWEKARTTGADLLWRTKSSHVLDVQRRLGDGSYLSTIYPSTKDRRHDANGSKVRVIEYSLGESVDDDTTYRLLTTMLDPKVASATELAALYKERWEFETALDELKSHQRSPRVVLRSKMPDGVLQEAYAYLCVHFAIRWLMHSVALGAGEDPDRLSFTRTLRVARRSTASHPGFSPSGARRGTTSSQRGTSL
jgi:hypothetical protein